MTARDLVEQALKQIGAVASTAPMTEAEAADGLLALQGLVNTLKTHRLTIAVLTRATYTVTASVASYTLGTGQTWNGARPVWIERATLVDTDGGEYALELLSNDRWSGIADKTLTGWPVALYNSGAYPYTTLTLYPTPTDARIASCALYTPTPMGEPATLDAVLVLPEASYEALLYGLAVRCAPPYGKPLDPTLATLAQEALGAWKRSNRREEYLSLDPGLLSAGAGTGFDWRTGE